jgi:hypothetical protein
VVRAANFRDALAIIRQPEEDHAEMSAQRARQPADWWACARHSPCWSAPYGAVARTANFRGALVIIRQTEEDHAEMSDLLKQLRKN